jgi:hypothetical protein
VIDDRCDSRVFVQDCHCPPEMVRALPNVKLRMEMCRAIVCHSLHCWKALDDQLTVICDYFANDGGIQYTSDYV